MSKIATFETKEAAQKEASEFLGWNAVEVFANEYGSYHIATEGGLLHEDGTIQ